LVQIVGLADAIRRRTRLPAGDVKMKNLLLGILICGLSVLAGCSEEDSHRISRVGGKALDKAQGLAHEAAERIGLNRVARTEEAKAENLAERVNKRLRWDQALEGAELHATSEQQVVTVKGTVKDEAQKSRAVDLAGTTAGVESVRDEIQLRKD
jgi:osmotically-inducible protein OsmY